MDEEMHFTRFLETVEDCISSAVRESCPRSWDENFITYSLCQKLISERRISVTGLNRPFELQWDAVKFTGKTEQLLGDLGVLVRLSGWDGEIIEGVGLLEAKKRSRNSASFDAVKKSQLT